MDEPNLDNDRSPETVGRQRRRPMPDWLKVGIGAVATVLVGVGATLLLGYPLGLPFYPLMCVTLMLLVFVSAVALFRGENRRGMPLWYHLAALSVTLVPLYAVTLGPFNFMGLIGLRTRVLIALTGGQDELQAWAVEMLAKPRDSEQADGSGWLVPREQWSEQIQRLGPKARLVRIDPLFEGERDAVRLGYGGGFFHWYIVVGPPESGPDPNGEKEHPLDVWCRWGDGIYGWFPEN